MRIAAAWSRWGAGVSCGGGAAAVGAGRGAAEEVGGGSPVQAHRVVTMDADTCKRESLRLGSGLKAGGGRTARILRRNLFRLHVPRDVPE